MFELNSMGGNDTVIWAPGEGSDVVAGPTGLKFDSNEWAEDLGFTAPPEMEANATAFMPRR